MPPGGLPSSRPDPGRAATDLAPDAPGGSGAIGTGVPSHPIVAGRPTRRSGLLPWVRSNFPEQSGPWRGKASAALIRKFRSKTDRDSRRLFTDQQRVLKRSFAEVVEGLRYCVQRAGARAGRAGGLGSCSH